VKAFPVLALLTLGVSGPVIAAFGAVPEQIVPTNPEPGSPVFTRPSTSTTTGGTTATSSYQGAGERRMLKRH